MHQKCKGFYSESSLDVSDKVYMMTEKYQRIQLIVNNSSISLILYRT
jgi:hypothetical protein